MTPEWLQEKMKETEQPALDFSVVGDKFIVSVFGVPLYFVMVGTEGVVFEDDDHKIVIKAEKK